MILAIDPGRDKLGIAIYDPVSQEVFKHEVFLTKDFTAVFSTIKKEWSLEMIIIGNGTCSEIFQTDLTKLFPEIPLQIIPEEYSTLEGRNLYYQLYPPKGLKRLIPLSLQTPTRPIDDLVAIVLLQRYLGKLPRIRR